MPATIFTVEEANNLLPQLMPLMEELLTRRAKIIRQKKEMVEFVGDNRSNVGSRSASLIALEFQAIETLIKRIRSFGCHIKDLNVGLLDFLGEVQGRQVWLCWRFGESKIEYYHELNAGFAGRRKIP